MPGPFTSPVSLSTPFEPNRSPIWNGSAGPSGITSLNAQDAIEEVKTFAETVARFSLVCAFDGTGSTGRWLAWMQNNPSNNNPLHMPKNGVITELTFTSSSASTTTITLFKNAVSTGVTISTAAQSSQTVININYPFVAGDDFSFQVTSGSSGRPTVVMFSRFT
jgi:hypothetical protein